MFNDVFNGMFGKLEPGLCRLDMTGKIAVKVSSGYKSYNLSTGTLVNSANFVFPVGDEFFFVIPTNKAEVGDILLINHKPKCVIKVDDKTITVINYEDSTVETILPERHMFMGNTYFYGKIVSMFGSGLLNGNGAGKIMKYMMLSEMMKGGSSNGMGNFGGMLPMMMLMGGKGDNPLGDMFSGLTESFDLLGDINVPVAEASTKEG